MRTWLPVVFLTAGALCAQEVPVPDGKGRLLRLFDLDRVRAVEDAPAETTGADAAPAGTPPPKDPVALSAPPIDTASFLRSFLEPPLGAGDDLQVLGGRWLTLLGRPAQAAALEALLASAAEFAQDFVEVEIEVLVVPKATFESCCARPLAAGRRDNAARWQLAMSHDDADTMLAAARAANASEIVGPRLTTSPLQAAVLQIAHQISYIKDFTVSRTTDGVIADPVVDTVVDGITAEVRALPLRSDVVAVACKLRVQQVEQPIAEYETTIAEKQKVKVQLPRVSGIEFEQTARLRTDERVVFAAQKANGDYVMALVGASIRKQAK